MRVTRGSEVQGEMIGSQLGVANFWQVLCGNRKPFATRQLVQVAASFLIHEEKLQFFKSVPVLFLELEQREPHF